MPYPYPIFSDPSSLLGVRLPPDTEIIKYTSSMVGPKVPGTTNRGRKKTISLEQNALLGSAQQHNANGRGGGGNSAQSNEGRSASSSGDRGNNDSSADSMSAKRSRLVSSGREFDCITFVIIPK